MSYDVFDHRNLYEQAIKQYNRLNPRDRRDAEFFMNAETFEEFERIAPKERGRTARLFDIPVHIDDNLPDGMVSLLAETQLDRAVRRANERGHALNVMPPPAFPVPVEVPATDPTLKALLKHWWRKWISTRSPR